MPHSAYARAPLGAEVPNSGQVFDIGSQGYARTRAHTCKSSESAGARLLGKSPQIQQNSACTTEEKL